MDIFRPSPIPVRNELLSLIVFGWSNAIIFDNFSSRCNKLPWSMFSVGRLLICVKISEIFAFTLSVVDGSFECKTVFRTTVSSRSGLRSKFPEPSSFFALNEFSVVLSLLCELCGIIILENSITTGGEPLFSRLLSVEELSFFSWARAGDRTLRVKFLVAFSRSLSLLLSPDFVESFLPWSFW